MPKISSVWKHIEQSKFHFLLDCINKQNILEYSNILFCAIVTELFCVHLYMNDRTMNAIYTLFYNKLLAMHIAGIYQFCFISLLQVYANYV